MTGRSHLLDPIAQAVVEGRLTNKGAREICRRLAIQIVSPADLRADDEAPGALHRAGAPHTGSVGFFDPVAARAHALCRRSVVLGRKVANLPDRSDHVVEQHPREHSLADRGVALDRSLLDGVECETFDQDVGGDDV